MSTYSKYWCFTLNNPEVNRLPKWDDLVYRVYQLEKGESGTLHFQGFCIFSKKKRISSLKKLNDQAHWEKMQGSAQQARAYCMKEDTRQEGPWEEGAPWSDLEPTLGAGKRTDLLKVKEDIDSGMSLVDLYDKHFDSCAGNFKFFREYKFQKELAEANKLRDVEVILYFGVAGSGKTFRAFDKNPGAYILHKSNNGLWWPGYDRQKTVIFDDFDGTWMPISTLLRLLDRYPMHVEDKGTSMPACWTKVVITSNLPIEDWYPDAYQKCPERLEAVKRRISYSVYFDKKYEPPRIKVGQSYLDNETAEAREHLRALDALACLDAVKQIQDPRSPGNTIGTCDQAPNQEPLTDTSAVNSGILIDLDQEDPDFV